MNKEEIQEILKPLELYKPRKERNSKEEDIVFVRAFYDLVALFINLSESGADHPTEDYIVAYREVKRAYSECNQSKDGEDIFDRKYEVKEKLLTVDELVLEKGVLAFDMFILAVTEIADKHLVEARK